MKIRPVGAELFYAERRTDKYTDKHDADNSRLALFSEHAQ